MVKEFKERWAQYKSEEHRGNQFVKWELDGWQWGWEANTRNSVIGIFVELPGGHTWHDVAFSISVGIEEEPFIALGVPVTAGSLGEATGSLVKWIKKEILAGVDDGDIALRLIASG